MFDNNEYRILSRERGTSKPFIEFRHNLTLDSAKDFWAEADHDYYEFRVEHRFVPAWERMTPTQAQVVLGVIN